LIVFNIFQFSHSHFSFQSPESYLTIESQNRCEILTEFGLLTQSKLTNKKGNNVALPLIDSNNLIEKLMDRKKTNPHQNQYLSMYSSWLGGITTEAPLMVLPLDDHMVHRGDGVFEAMIVRNGWAFLLKEHLKRLAVSASKIGISCPWSETELQEIISETYRITRQSDCFVRIFLSRGPGTFSVNPYDSIGPQLHVICTRYSPYPADKYLSGVTLGRSAIPAKEPWFAQIKSCNYLHNVLMKKESIDQGFDFMVAFDSQGHLTESATENIVILDNKRRLIRPELDFILKGTTMMRMLELARQVLQKRNQIGEPTDFGYTQVLQGSLREVDITSAHEVFLIGTTLNVLPVTRFQKKKIGDGMPGPVGKFLGRLLEEDILRGESSIML